MPTAAAGTLPTPAQQADRLIDLGLHQMAGICPCDLRAAVADVEAEDTLLVLDPHRAPATKLAPLIQRGGKPGFVVVDMPDADEFQPIEGTVPPAGAAYLLCGPDRGDHLANWSPDEALPEIQRTGRTPMTLSEGIHWLIQQPDVLERGHCFMTIASRLRKPNGALDARTPALWISNGTGRDGRHNRHAPKVGWCWAGNRHTWLGFASAAGRHRLPMASPGCHSCNDRFPPDTR